MQKYTQLCSFALFTEDGLGARRRTSIRLRGAVVGRGIWPFSEKLHETGDGTLGKYHAVFRQLCENRVSGLYDIQSIPDIDGT